MKTYTGFIANSCKRQPLLKRTSPPHATTLHKGLPDASSFDWLSRLGELEALSREQQQEQQQIEEGCKDDDETKQRN